MWWRNYDNMFGCFDRIPEHDGQTNRQTDRIAICVLMCDKNGKSHERWIKITLNNINKSNQHLFRKEIFQTISSKHLHVLQWNILISYFITSLETKSNSVSQAVTTVPTTQHTNMTAVLCLQEIVNMSNITINYWELTEWCDTVELSFTFQRMNINTTANKRQCICIKTALNIITTRNSAIDNYICII